MTHHPPRSCSAENPRTHHSDHHQPGQTPRPQKQAVQQYCQKQAVQHYWRTEADSREEELYLHYSLAVQGQVELFYGPTPEE